MNERGFAVAVLLVPGEKPVHQETGKVPITTTTAVRLLLDRAATVDEALDLLARYDMHHAIGSAFHFHLADASGVSTVVEWGPNGAAHIIRPAAAVPERGRPVRPVADAPDSSSAVPFVPQVCTNFRLDARPAEPSARLGTDRFDLLRDALATSGGLLSSPEAAMELLAAVAHPRTEWNPGDLTAGTQWSAVFDLTESSALLCSNCNWTHKVTLHIL